MKPVLGEAPSKSARVLLQSLPASPAKGARRQPRTLVTARAVMPVAVQQ